MNLVIVGSVALDTVQTPLGRVDRALGGSATYAALAASYFTSPGIVATVGGDFPRRHLNLLKRKGIRLDGLQIDPRGQTFFWSGCYQGDMNRAITRETRLNVFASFNPVIPKPFSRAPFLLLGNIHPQLQLDVLAQMARPRLVLCDTMNYWIGSEPALLRKVFRKSDVLCINETEACQFSGAASLPRAAAALLRLGPRWVIVKKGAHGVNLFARGTFFALPAIPVKRVVDPTGAGDSFAGGALGSLCRAGRLDGNAFRRAVAVGTVMASYCVEDFSCRRITRLSRADIRSRLAQLRAFTRLP